MNVIMMSNVSEIADKKAALLAILGRTRRALGAAWPFDFVRGRLRLNPSPWQFRHLLEELLIEGQIVELWFKAGRGAACRHLLILAARWTERPPGNLVGVRGRADVLDGLGLDV